MAPYFDYSPPQLPDIGAAIAPIGDALTDVLNRRQKQQQFNADLALRRDQETRRLKQEQDQFDIQQAAQRRRDEQAEAKFAIDQNQIQQQSARSIQEAPTMAEKRRVAAATVYYNPETRRVEHPSIEQAPAADVGPEPQPPQEPQPAQPIRSGTDVPPLKLAPPDVLAPPDELTARMRQRARPSVLGPVGHQVVDQRAAEAGAAEDYRRGVAADVRAGRAAAAHAQDVTAQAMGDYAKKKEAFTAEHDAFVNARSRAEEQAPYTVHFGKGSEFTSTLAGERYEANTRNAQAFGASLPETGLTNAERRAREATMAALESGTIKKEQAGAYFQKYANGIETGEIKESEGDLNRKAAETRARIMAEGRREATEQSGARGEHTEEKDNRKQVSDDIDKFLAGRGAKDLGSQMADVDRTLEKLKSGNTREAQTAVLNMLRSDIGKGSRLNMYEVRHFGTDSGLSAGDALANRFEQYLTGGQGDKAHALAVGAMQHLHQNLRARANALSEEARDRFVNDPNYAPVKDYADNLLSQRIPGYTRIRQKQAGAPPEVAAGRSAQRKVKLKGMSQEQLRAAAASMGIPLPPNEGP